MVCLFSRGFMLNTLVNRFTILMGLQWVIFNATHICTYALKRPPCIHSQPSLPFQHPSIQRKPMRLAERKTAQNRADGSFHTIQIGIEIQIVVNIIRAILPTRGADRYISNHSLIVINPSSSILLPPSSMSRFHPQSK